MAGGGGTRRHHRGWQRARTGLSRPGGRPEPGDGCCSTRPRSPWAWHGRLRHGGRAPRPAAGRSDCPGHLVKARYTPLQATVLGADEQGSPLHEALREADALDGMPVIVADLHSALPACWPGDLRDRPVPRTPRGPRAEEKAGSGPRACYVMLDGGALPAWFSRPARSSARPAGWRGGHGGPGLRRRRGGGDAAHGPAGGPARAGGRHGVVTQGPGNLGTGTRWGFSGVAAGEAVNAAAVARGPPGRGAAGQRGDRRERHIGRLPPQPDRLREGRAGPGRGRRAGASRRLRQRG